MGRGREGTKKKKDCGKLDDDVKRHLNVNLCRRANSKKGASIHDFRTELGRIKKYTPHFRSITGHRVPKIVLTTYPNLCGRHT